MSDVIDELAEAAEGRLDRAHVERRLADWVQRVSELYDSIEGWLPPDFTTSRRRLLPVQEKMMAHFGVSQVHIPVLEIFRSGAWFGKLVPYGLWIVGANGRLDLWVPSGHFLIVDRAQNFNAPNWMMAPSQDRRREYPLTPAAFSQAIGA